MKFNHRGAQKKSRQGNLTHQSTPPAKLTKSPYAFSLQKQIVGVEIEASVFRFFGDTLIGFEAGGIKNEPLQLGVRSVAEMAVYQILTDFLRLPSSEECRLVEAKFYNKA